MAKLIIGDLREDAELDAAAMKAIGGGNRAFRQHGSRLERRFRAGATFAESSIIPGLILVGDLRGGQELPALR